MLLPSNSMGFLEQRCMIWLRGSGFADALVWMCYPLSRNVARYAIESLIKNNICDSELMAICFKLIRGTDVNLIDLVNGGRNNGKVKTFPMAQKLSDYTLDEEKTFPRKNIHAGDLLKYLLRHIANPNQDDRRGKGEKGPGVNLEEPAQSSQILGAAWISILRRGSLQVHWLVVEIRDLFKKTTNNSRLRDGDCTVQTRISQH